jgi:hypothetical protein
MKKIMFLLKHWKTALVILAALSASLALADDFKTTAGKEYKDATVTRVEPDGIIVKTKSGISKLYFGELPREVQEHFHYDPQTATAYAAAQAAVYEADAKQHEEVRHRQEEADAQNRANVAKHQTATGPSQASLDQELVREQQKDLRNANRPRPERTPKYTTVLHQLPVVRSQPSPQIPKSTKSNKK